MLDCADVVCGSASSGGTGHVCETLDGLTARPVQVRLLPHGRQRAHKHGHSLLDLDEDSPTLVIVSQTCSESEAPRESRGFDFVVSQKAHVSNTAKLVLTSGCVGGECSMNPILTLRRAEVLPRCL